MVLMSELCPVHLPLLKKFRIDWRAWEFNIPIIRGFCLCGSSHGSLLKFFPPSLHIQIQTIAVLPYPSFAVHGFSYP